MNSTKLLPETIKQLKDFYEKNSPEDKYGKLKPNLEIQELVMYVLQNYFTNLKINRIQNIDFGSWSIDINLIVDL